MMDCGDNSCLFAESADRGGMRTNGGCRCLADLNLRGPTGPAVKFVKSWLADAKAEGIREGMERAAKVVLEYSPGRAWDWETSLDIREGLAEAIHAAAKGWCPHHCECEDHYMEEVGAAAKAGKEEG